MSRTLRRMASVVLTATVLIATPGAAHAIEDYADYQPQTKCSPQAKPGTKALARWLVKRGGSAGPISRPCKSGGTSEHKEGRAFDWMVDVRHKKERRLAPDFLDYVFATDSHGHEDAKARRMGIMYIIWNDHIYSPWDRFEKQPYLAPGCKSRKKCSATLRHKNNLHISLSRKGGRGDTSWYDTRVH
jgi:hypothetical protein